MDLSSCHWKDPFGLHESLQCKNLCDAKISAMPISSLYHRDNECVCGDKCELVSGRRSEKLEEARLVLPN
jgi:hypothetical protein